MKNKNKINEARTIVEKLDLVEDFINTLAFILDDNYEELLKISIQKENAPMWLAHEFNRTGDHMANIHHMLRKNINEAEELRKQLIEALSSVNETD